jgi:hypothetical protein
MATPQPIEEWFGIEPHYNPPPAKRTRQQMLDQKSKDKEQAVQKPTAAEHAAFIQHAVETGDLAAVAAATGDVPGITEDEAWFRHHNWAAKRSLVRQALTDAGTGSSSLNSFDNCGCCCTVEYSQAEQRYRVRGCYCHNRHCEPCMKAKSTLIVNNLRAELKNRDQADFRFITLTLKHDKATPLKAQIKRLYACYNKLRKSPLWKRSQKGGVATLEVKWVEPGEYPGKGGSTCHSEGGWHPHLHIISQGQYLSTYDLSDQWYAITGDSYMVDVRFMSRDKDVAFYVGKYVTKGTNDAVWSKPTRAAEWVKAVKGVRMAATFGNWRGIKLLAKAKEEPGTWEFVASLSSLVRRMHAGEQHALHLLIVLTETASYDPHRKRSPKPK